MNTTFEVNRVLDILENFDDQFQPEIGRQRSRWPGSVTQYNSAFQRMYTFADRRADYMRGFIRDKFGIDSDIDVTLRVSPPNSGLIKVNSKSIKTFPWHGYYFKNIPLELTAIPKPGYRFERWEFLSEPDAHVVFPSQGNLNTIAIFERVDTTFAELVINEINYNSGPDYPAKDWFELYNPSDVSLSLTGWKIRDGQADHLWELPAHAEIPARGHAVICTDTTFFHKIFSQASNVYGDMPFNLSNAGDSLYLYFENQLVDSVFFDDELPWPIEADGTGYTLELRDPTADNTTPESWRVSGTIGGTPGRSNSTKTKVDRMAEMPSEFSLKQNYPNPFNSTTTIEFSLAQPGHVKLKIYDVRGRQVESLLNGHFSAGVHKTTWHAKAPSGLYFYRLEVSADERSLDQKKLLLIK
jgi:hypothetical protein